MTWTQSLTIIILLLGFMLTKNPEAFSIKNSFSSLTLTSTCSQQVQRRSFRTLLSQTNKGTSLDIPESYPIARKKLIKKARQLDPTLNTKKSGSYSTVGWSNRLGTVLTPASIPGVYTACRPFYWNKIDVGCRMTVIELQSKSQSNNKDDENVIKPDLFIHSPVALDGKLMEAINKLGNVKHVVSPNYEHVKYAKVWGETYENAYMWACPGMMEREPEVRWTGEIPYGARPPEYPMTDTSKNSELETVEGMWNWNEIQPLHVDVEFNPFTSKPFFNEVVFYHKSSKTLLTTDTYWNYPKSDGVTNSNYEDIPNNIQRSADDDGFTFDWELAPSVEKIPFGTRLWKIGMDKLFRPFYLNLMIKNDKKSDFQKIAKFVSGLGDSCWDVETVIPAHGDVVRGSKFVRNVLKDHFNIQ